MEISVLINPNSKHLSEAKGIIDVINRQQNNFRLKLLEVNWLAKTANDTKRVSDKQVIKEIKEHFSNVPVVALIQNSFTDGYFSHYTEGSHIISMAEWDTKYSFPPIGVYLALMLSEGIICLASNLPDDVSDSMLHEPPIGCISDYCSDKDTIRLSMSKMHLCGECKRKLAENGMAKGSIVSVEDILEYVKEATNRYIGKTLHDVFLCHSSKDKNFTRRLANDLAFYGYKVWFDQFEMLPGDSLIEEIQQGIRDSGCFIIVLSPNSVKSRWCIKEMNAALMLEFKRPKLYVVPILYKKCDIPLFLEEKLRVDFRGRNYDDGLSALLKRLRGK